MLLAATVGLAAVTAAAAPRDVEQAAPRVQIACPAVDPGAPVPQDARVAAPVDHLLGLLERVDRYELLADTHRLSGLASYYSSYFDGRRTANGEVYRSKKISAAHLTLPLGTWVEVIARKSGKKLRMRINDRGPYARKFVLDLSQAAARELGVHVGNREVDVRIIALPGEEPLPEDYETVIAEFRSSAGSEIPDPVLTAR